MAKPNIQIPWQQLVRLDGSLIEDNGVANDFVVRPTVGDIINSDLPSSQFDQIAKHLLPHLEFPFLPGLSQLKYLDVL